MAYYYGIRHLSPNGAYQLINLLNDRKPDIVLVEGGSDLNDLIPQICGQNVKLPIAIMSYSQTIPIRTVLYPFAEYSPEYQAIKWAVKNGKQCRFIDLPSSVFLALMDISEKRRLSSENQDNSDNQNEYDKEFGSIYTKLEKFMDEDQESWWERHFEQLSSYEDYAKASEEYGRNLRIYDDKIPIDDAENYLREAYMRYNIDLAEREFDSDKIVVVTGAYHTYGIKNNIPLTEDEIKKLPSLPNKSTLMPYSYYRLSQRSGYGAGNKAPMYYELLWFAINHKDLKDAGIEYLTNIASYQRSGGNFSSSAEVIEAVRLANELAKLKGSNVPVLQDLRDSAVTCMGHGKFSEISEAVANIEIGTKIGSLPEGVSNTSIQEDFYFKLKDLKLEKYKSVVVQQLDLDLRENMRVKSEKAAFLDLERSFFLHKLCCLGVHFAENMNKKQDNATWAEQWSIAWTPETEIDIIESTLKGDTIDLAVSFVFNERLEKAQTITEASEVISDACLCGMADSVKSAVSVLQALATNSASVEEIAETARNISFVIRYGNIRKTNPEPLLPLLEQLFYRGCLIMPESCVCDNNAVAGIIKAISALNEISINHSSVNVDEWKKTLTAISKRDDLNTKASGYATAILLERGDISNDMLSIEVERRLSRGIHAELGAGWFEGLSLRNRYALIARLSLWEKLSQYIDCLDDEEFKRALVFLRRAFCEFSPNDKCDIAENLGEIWGVNPDIASEIINNQFTDAEQDILDGLDDFDFGDL